MCCDPINFEGWFFVSVLIKQVWILVLFFWPLSAISVFVLLHNILVLIKLDRFSAQIYTFKFIYLYHILSYVNYHLNFRIVVFIWSFTIYYCCKENLIFFFHKKKLFILSSNIHCYASSLISVTPLEIEFDIWFWFFILFCQLRSSGFLSVLLFG